jgi:hypothetical protein
LPWSQCSDSTHYIQRHPALHQRTFKTTPYALPQGTNRIETSTTVVVIKNSVVAKCKTRKRITDGRTVGWLVDLRLRRQCTSSFVGLSGRVNILGCSTCRSKCTCSHFGRRCRRTCGSCRKRICLGRGVGAGSGWILVVGVECLQGDFKWAPNVGKVCVRREVIAEVYAKPLCCGVEQTHG